MLLVVGLKFQLNTLAIISDSQGSLSNVYVLVAELQITSFSQLLLHLVVQHTKFIILLFIRVFIIL